MQNPTWIVWKSRRLRQITSTSIDRETLSDSIRCHDHPILRNAAWAYTLNGSFFEFSSPATQPATLKCWINPLFHLPGNRRAYRDAAVPLKDSFSRDSSKLEPSFNTRDSTQHRTGQFYSHSVAFVLFISPKPDAYLQDQGIRASHNTQSYLFQLGLQHRCRPWFIGISTAFGCSIC